MKRFTDLNNTGKYLSHIIFKPGSMNILLEYGLENVYLDDYNHRCKYIDCLFFLVKPKYPRTTDTYGEFEAKITNFISFYDYYELEEGVVYIFKIPDNLIPDVHLFKEGLYKQLSDDFWKSIGAKTALDFSHVKFDIKKEILNFNYGLLIPEQNKIGG